MHSDDSLKKKVAIVIPLSNRIKLTRSEEISLLHLNHCLGKFDKFFVISESSEFHCNVYELVRFSDRYFGNKLHYNRLVLSSEFYQKFNEYEYILIYHLDSLVFKDELLKWCEKGYDYIGSPWIFGPDLPWLSEEGVGNGGFSLRKVEAFEKLSKSKLPWEKPSSKVKKLLYSDSFVEAVNNAKQLFMSFLPSKNNISHHINNSLNNNEYEDRFICKYGPKYYPGLKIAPIDVALKFAFETNPRICFKRNNNKLPFGCHAWEKYDKEFWSPFLLKKEAKLLS